MGTRGRVLSGLMYGLQKKKLSEAIGSLREDIVYLSGKYEKGKATPQQLNDLKEKRKQLEEKCQKLRTTINNRQRQRKYRQHRRTLLAEHPEIAATLRYRSKPGQPPLEVDQPELLNAIVEIATFGAPAHERRRSESLRSIKSLTALTKQLELEGHRISRSAVYYRLLPRRGNTIEGRRHANTVPVRMKRAFNDAHKSHIDSRFCQATINYLEELASILGPDQVLFISQDDKARVPIGITAANKQAPMLMHLDYQVKLPDHDWVVAEKHKLIPSVYGFMKIKSGMMGDLRAVTYSGPTYIAIRSGKHCSSTAYSHAKDLSRILNDEDFLDFTHSETGNVKPVIMLIVDGGPDENPRYEKVINSAIDHFKMYDLDAIFIATNAPGRSAFNRVERRMAPLSRELCGVILQHDYFGTHLDERGRTIDEEKEKANFEHAGELLAELWSSLILDSYKTKAIYVNPEDSELVINLSVSEEWKARHVRESHYFLQIIKCDDVTCCSPPRGNIKKLIPGFMPAPICIEQNSLKAGNNSDKSNAFTSLLLRLQINDLSMRNTKSNEIPYDTCCPSVQDIISTRVCSKCGIYFASVKSVKAHLKSCKKYSALNENPSLFGANIFSRLSSRPVRITAKRARERMVIWASQLNNQHVDWVEEEDLEDVIVENETPSTNIEVSNIVNMSDYMNSVWEEEK